VAGVAGTTYAESPDGVRWTKPILRQYRFEGSLENNFVALAPDLSWPANAIENVVYDPDDADPQRRFKGFLGAHGRQPPRYHDPADYNADIYNVGIFRYEGLYVGMPAVYHATGRLPTANTDGFHLIQLISSRDLRTWRRLGDQPRGEFRWSQGSLESLKGQQVSLRFTLREGSFYAYWLAE